MTTTTPRAAGQAPELTYEPSYCVMADLAREIPEATQSVDPGGVGYISGCKTLARSPWGYRYPELRYGPRGRIADLPTESGRRLRRFRIAADMTQPELAAHVGISMFSINSYEVGRLTLERAAYGTVCAIAAALDVAPEELFGDVPPARVA